MLDGMLEYLAVSVHDERPGAVDLSDCLEQALENLQAMLDESDAHIVSTELPTVAGDAYQLQHLLQNIIANAIKFRSQERPRIRISADAREGLWRLAIHDNGIGIAASYRNSVFDMGKRLHTREEYPGSGIGLTLCKRILERHGGNIRIDAADGGGSVVIVELPRSTMQIAPGAVALSAD
jgi:light-regulated signal transduction histidine kinase (bacteriophytochrome)